MAVSTWLASAKAHVGSDVIEVATRFEVYDDRLIVGVRSAVNPDWNFLLVLNSLNFPLGVTRLEGNSDLISGRLRQNEVAPYRGGDFVSGVFDYQAVDALRGIFKATLTNLTTGSLPEGSEPITGATIVIEALGERITPR